MKTDDSVTASTPGGTPPEAAGLTADDLLYGINHALKAGDMVAVKDFMVALAIVAPDQAQLLLDGMNVGRALQGRAAAGVGTRRRHREHPQQSH